MCIDLCDDLRFGPLSPHSSNTRLVVASTLPTRSLRTQKRLSFFALSAARSCHLNWRMMSETFCGPIGIPPFLVLISHVVYGDRHALPKILYAMDLSVPSEARQAESMLEQWPQLSVEDALQILGRYIRLPTIRAYAVQQLDRYGLR